MAKVMISLPDELLARVDARARQRGSSRSATIRELTQASLCADHHQLALRMAELEGRAVGHGGGSVAELKAGRPR